MTLWLFFLIQSCYVPSYMVLGCVVPELHDMRTVCLLKVITTAWVTNTDSFSLVIDYTQYSG